MVAHFKKYANPSAVVYPVTRDIVEIELGRRKPWFREGRQRDDECHYAVCPYCHNPIQLKGIYRRHETSPRPYGSHTGKAEEGFAHFNLTDLECCPYRIKDHAVNKHARREMGEAATVLINLVIDEFDRIVLLLRDAFGFPFSNRFARIMLEQWFSSKGYLYEGAHLRNLPWIIAYLGPSQSLYSQYVGKNEALAAKIKGKVASAVITDAGQLRFTEGKWGRLDLQCLHHRTRISDKSHEITEQMTLRVQDFTHTNDPGKAPLVYSKIIHFDPARFEHLLQPQGKYAKRNQDLLDIAITIGKKWGFR